MKNKNIGFPEARVVSDGSAHCFFGYYDKCPWDQSNRYLLFHRILGSGIPGTEISATIGYCDTERGNHFTPLAATDTGIGNKDRCFSGLKIALKKRFFSTGQHLRDMERYYWILTRVRRCC